jgi:hypothetical protein
MSPTLHRTVLPSDILDGDLTRKAQNIDDKTGS